MGVFDSAKLPGGKKTGGAKISAEDRFAKKQKEKTLARVGLRPEDADGTVTDKRPPPVSDTRKVGEVGAVYVWLLLPDVKKNDRVSHCRCFIPPLLGES